MRFNENKKCLDGMKFQNGSDSYILRSIIHEMYLQRVQISTLSPFDDKRCYENNIEINL